MARVQTRTKRQLTFEEERVRRWIVKNRGVLSHIAVRVGVCEQFVHSIAYGRANTASISGPKVLGELRRAGWPGIRRSIL